MNRSAGATAIALLVACNSGEVIQEKASQAAINIAISPPTTVLGRGAQQQFMAIIEPSNQAVAWAVAEGPQGGSVSPAGIYTAPAADGVYHVVVALQSDRSNTAIATVTVSAQPMVSVRVDPTSVVLRAGAAQRFTATVKGSANTGVRWAVQESGGGTVDEFGNYTAPPTPGAFHVVAASIADPTQMALATVTVQALASTVTISISPSAATVGVSARQQFTAFVAGATDQQVTWSVQEGAVGGTITEDGIYTAPASAGTYHVVAASHADHTRSATAAVAVTSGAPRPVVAVTIAPTSTSLVAGGSTKFHATVIGASDTAVIWSVQEGPPGGTVDGSGNYVAPSAAGTYHVVATSHADPSRSAIATVSVASRTATIAIDPPSITTWPGTPLGFVAKVSTGATTRVFWTVQEPNGGQIDPRWGNYTAPTTPGVYHVGATNQTSGETATAAVTVVNSGIVVTIKFGSHLMSSKHDHVGSVRLGATVHGTSDQTVSWAALDGGSIGYEGSTAYYYLPSAPGIYHVQATSRADPSAQATLIWELNYDDLLDFGGSVLPSSRIYAVWWGPMTDFAPDVVPSVETYLGGLNGTPYLALLDQYMRSKGTTTAFAGSLYDDSLPPASAPSSSDVAAEVCKVLLAKGVAPQPENVYLLYTSNSGEQGHAAYYCGWHSFGSCQGVTIQTALVPNPVNTPCLGTPMFHCNNASDSARSVILTTAHELAEVITDPGVSAWFSNQGSEIADKCVFDPPACASVGGRTWELPALWSNQVHDCAHQ